MQHFIRVCAICLAKIDLKRKRYSIVFGNYMLLSLNILNKNFHLTFSNFMGNSTSAKSVDKRCSPLTNLTCRPAHDSLVLIPLRSSHCLPGAYLRVRKYACAYNLTLQVKGFQL